MLFVFQQNKRGHTAQFHFYAVFGAHRSPETADSWIQGLGRGEGETLGHVCGVYFGDRDVLELGRGSACRTSGNATSLFALKLFTDCGFHLRILF